MLQSIDSEMLDEFEEFTYLSPTVSAEDDDMVAIRLDDGVIISTYRSRKAAAILGISEQTLWDRTKEGLAFHIRIDQENFYPASMVKNRTIFVNKQ